MLAPYERQRLRESLKGPARPPAPWLPPTPVEPFPVKSALSALSDALLSLKWLLGVAHNGRTGKGSVVSAPFFLSIQGILPSGSARPKRRPTLGTSRPS